MKYVFCESEIDICPAVTKGNCFPLGKHPAGGPAFLYHLFQVMRAQEGVRVVSVCKPILEVFGDKDLYLISGYI